MHACHSTATFEHARGQKPVTFSPSVHTTQLHKTSINFFRDIKILVVHLEALIAWQLDPSVTVSERNVYKRRGMMLLPLLVGSVSRNLQFAVVCVCDA